MILLAHHLEPHHFPVLIIFLAVGVWLGWQAASLPFRRRETQSPATPELS